LPPTPPASSAAPRTSGGLSMAARENQGLQIALIIFVILTIILTVTTFLFFQSNQELKETNKKLSGDINTAETKARTASDDMGKMLALVDAKLDKADAADTEAKKDFEKHGKGMAEASYRNLVTLMAKERDDLNKRIVELTAQKDELSSKIKADEDAKKKEFEKYDETVATTAKDLADERAKFKQDRDRIDGENTALNKRFEEKRGEFEALSKKSGEEMAALGEKNKELKTLLLAKNEEALRAAQANEIPDGKVTWVNQRTRTVWIDLGRADGLRQQTSFSVFPETVANPAAGRGEPKGKLEVTRLLDDPHMAEARIVEDDLSDPMMPGDRIFSMVWEPNRAEHFALAGVLDFDGDGVSDRKRIYDLIALNGGVIDEEVAENGTKKGQMSINTKYLVVGDPPSEVAKDASVSAYSEIRGEAQTLGVRIINVKEFIDYLGYKPDNRTVGLGTNARSEDFKARFPDDIQPVVPYQLRNKDMRRPPPTFDRTQQK
jgi:hypothetical protein